MSALLLFGQCDDGEGGGGGCEAGGGEAISIKAEFTQALQGTLIAAKHHHYVPTNFIHMLAEHGGVETTRRLLSKPEIQAGLMEMWQLGLLHQTMEAVIWENPRFHVLFYLYCN